MSETKLTKYQIKNDTWYSTRLWKYEDGRCQPQKRFKIWTTSITNITRCCNEDVNCVKYAVIYKLERSRSTPQQTCINVVPVTGHSTRSASWT